MATLVLQSWNDARAYVALALGGGERLVDVVERVGRCCEALEWKLVLVLFKEGQRPRQHGRVVGRDAYHRLVAEHESGRVELECLAEADIADLDVAAELAEHLQAL